MPTFVCACVCRYLHVDHVLPQDGEVDAGKVSEDESLHVVDEAVPVHGPVLAEARVHGHEEETRDVPVDEPRRVGVAQTHHYHLVALGVALRQRRHLSASGLQYQTTEAANNK